MTLYYDPTPTSRELALILIHRCPLCEAASNESCAGTRSPHRERIRYACEAARDDCTKLAVPPTTAKTE